MEYSSDAFVPDRFHRWVGLSLIAGAVQRKVSLKQDLIHYFPNIYVMLVSHPKQGKSTAIDRGADLLESFRRDLNPNFRIIPTRVTDAAFIEEMKIVERIPLAQNPSIMVPQSAGYFYAGEASASALQNLYGDFVATLTAMYDCPKFYRSKTKGNPLLVEIENACMNVLAGTTFSYLRELVNDRTIEGGFASRLIYVVAPERKVRDGIWETKKEGPSASFRNALIQDLNHINGLMGPVKVSDGWRKRYEAWQPEFDQYIIDLNSSALESLLTRKDMNLIKVSMLLSISESDSLILEERHFDEALELIDDTYKDARMVLATSAIADKNSQRGITQFIAQTLKREKKLNRAVLKSRIVTYGCEVDRVEKTLDMMIQSKWISFDGEDYHIIVNPDDYL
jgi:hypothetical protein